ncbi:regulator of G protein signaling superfamily [Basidiobolus meristosporus CBS 931.73]|uniref:Regulator of G protein signaling superfamily n=1 Tax=Basidiobolus meristosporus CBS 931.73 TaxID=1314790 RepID=A0A1Y1YND7_9FUNG|nr:regulator of G protein signaling superfamily [Basidiobolus meristosporus CBS 931.73]|eukprot:ORX99094.1 regulator of G protein signaling superfamily [Basidiobolus meristosporus CBS 931.73]
MYRVSEAKLISAFNVQENRNQQKLNTKPKNLAHVDHSNDPEICSLEYQPAQIFEVSKTPVKENWFVRNQKIVSNRFLRWSTGAVLIVHFVILVFVQCWTTRAAIYPIMGLTDCFHGWEWIPHQVFTMVYTFLMFILIVTLKNATDAYGIRSELLVICVVNGVISTFFIFYLNMSFVEQIDPDNQLVNLCFINFLTMQYQMIIKPVMVAQGRSNVFRLLTLPSRNKDLTLCIESFDILLNNPALLEQFKMFAAREFSVENIMFYESCLRFRQSAWQSEAAITSEAVNIFDKFIAYESPLTINLTGRTRQAIEDTLGDNVCHVHMFDEAIEEIKDLMFRNTFPRFLQSNRYRHFSWDSPTQV